MKPMIHAKSSARKYGGKPEDYLDLHQWMDSSKSAMADVRHRALLHSSFGCFLCEQVFGVERKNSAGNVYSPRDVAEDHCIEDLGFIPSVERWLGNMAIQEWMGGRGNKSDREKRTRQISYAVIPDNGPSSNTIVDLGDVSVKDWNNAFMKEDIYYDVKPELREGQMKQRLSPEISVTEIDG